MDEFVGHSKIISQKMPTVFFSELSSGTNDPIQKKTTGTFQREKTRNRLTGTHLKEQKNPLPTGEVEHRMIQR